MLGSYDGLSVRQLRTRRLRSVLTGGAVALGVGMVFGVLLLSGTVRATFDDLIDSAWGTTDLVVAPANNAGSLPSGVLDRIRTTSGVESAGGMIGANLQRLDSRGKAVDGPSGTMWTAGFDPAQPPYDFRYTAGRPAREGREVIVERGWARERGLTLGDTIPVLAPAGRAQLRVVGIFTFSSGLSFGGAGLAGVPLTEARGLFDQPDGWMTISVHVRDRDRVEEVQARLRRELGAGADVQTPSQVSDDVAEQLQALDVVLLLFGGMALFVGGFLILNSFTMTVLQRTRELGMLRTLGASRADVARSVLVEALVLAVAGTAAGLLLGLGMAEGLIIMLRGLEVPVGDLAVSGTSIAVAAVAGIVATLFGAALPARRAARLSPVQAAQGGAATMRARPGIGRLGIARRAAPAGAAVRRGLLVRRPARRRAAVERHRHHRHDGHVRRHRARRAVRDPADGRRARDPAATPVPDRRPTRRGCDADERTTHVVHGDRSGHRLGRDRRERDDGADVRADRRAPDDRRLRAGPHRAPRRCRARGGRQPGRSAERLARHRGAARGRRRHAAARDPRGPPRPHEPGDGSHRGGRPCRVGRRRPQSGEGRRPRSRGARARPRRRDRRLGLRRAGGRRRRRHDRASVDRAARGGCASRPCCRP